MSHFTSAFLPAHTTPAQLKTGSISPYYEDLSPFRGRLPSALFTTGTEDPLLDDTVNMAVKWMMFGGAAVAKVYPGCPHGFLGFPGHVLKEAEEALADAALFIRERLG